jgi:hypothetical protein
MYNYVGRVVKEVDHDPIHNRAKVKKFVIGCINDNAYQTYFEYYAIWDKGEWTIDLGPSLINNCEKFRQEIYTHLVDNIDEIFNKLISKE